jgi:hypothetical protein
MGVFKLFQCDKCGIPVDCLEELIAVQFIAKKKERYDDKPRGPWDPPKKDYNQVEFSICARCANLITEEFFFNDKMNNLFKEMP